MNPLIFREYDIRGITDLHFENFIECIRSRKRPTADVEEVHLSMNLNLEVSLVWHLAVVFCFLCKMIYLSI